VGTISESVHVNAPLPEVWRFYFDPATWPTWVDGYGSVEASESYPREGGTLRWRSTSGGRGTVEELVVEHRPRSVHRIAFSDPESEGELVTAFAAEAGFEGDAGTRVSQEVSYRVRGAGPLTWLTDPIFIRPQVGRSLRRSLERLRSEIEEEAPGLAHPR
jgi:uncharacterized protein YndB with AHSA1/START domain